MKDEKRHRDLLAETLFCVECGGYCKEYRENDCWRNGEQHGVRFGSHKSWTEIERADDEEECERSPYSGTRGEHVGGAQDKRGECGDDDGTDGFAHHFKNGN